MYNVQRFRASVPAISRRIHASRAPYRWVMNQVAKFLLLIAVFIVAYLVIKSNSRRREVGQQPRRTIGEDMVRCRVCGIHLPRSEGLTAGGEYFCSEEHLQISKK